jgi:hypothetical protein
MMSGDPLEPLQRLGAGRYSDGFLRAVDAALALHPKDRPQSVAQFRALLDAGRPAPARRNEAADDATLPPLAAAVPPPIRPLPRTPRQADEPTVIRHDGWASLAPTVTAAPATTPDAMAEPPGARRFVWVAAVGSVLALSVAGVLVVGPDHAAAPPVAIAVPAFAPPAPAPAPAPAPTLTPTATILAPAVPIAVPQPAPSRPETEPAVAEAMTTTTSATREGIAPAVLSEPAASAATAPRRATRVSAAAPPTTKGAPARCSDILQKASLEPLTADEAAFLRRECR